MKRNKANHWTDRVIDTLLANGAISAPYAEAYRFGMEALVLKTVHVISYALIAAVMRKMQEFLIIFSVLCIFRRNTGGFHANTRMGCYFFSCAVMGLSLWLCDVPIRLWQMHIMVPLLLLIMNIWAPIRNRNRRMNDDEAAWFKCRLKRESVIFLLTYITCVVLGSNYLAHLLTVGIFTDTSLMVLGKLQSEKANLKRQ